MTRRKKKRQSRTAFQVSFDIREVYIMKRTKGRSLYAWITFQDEYKIGIAVDSVKRNKTVNSAISGNIELLTVRKVRHARKVERKLHELFGDSRFRIKANKDGGGVTEWFYMTDAEYFVLELWLLYYQKKIYLQILIILVVVFISIFFYFKIESNHF